MIAKTAVVDESAYIAPSATIWHFANILQHARIEAECSIGTYTEIGRGSRIGLGTRIGAHCFLPPHSQIGEDVFIGPHCCFTDDMFPRIHHEGDMPYVAEPPIVEEGASIGASCVILPGIRIGRHARIAAGSLVTHDIPSFTAVKGRPAVPFQPTTKW